MADLQSRRRPRVTAVRVWAWRGAHVNDDGQVEFLCDDLHSTKTEALACGSKEDRYPGLRDLGDRLRDLRLLSGLLIEQVADHLECSHSKVSRFETGQARPSPRDVRDLLDLYEVDGPERDQLIETARRLRNPRGERDG